MKQKDTHIFKRRFLRKNSTKAERLLWRMVQNCNLVHKFRRQYSIGTYIVDFYCHELRLAVEVDGYTHGDDKVYGKDLEKQRFLEKIGCRVRRYLDDQILNSTESVYLDLKIYCEQLARSVPHPNPLPKGEGTI